MIIKRLVFYINRYHLLKILAIIVFILSIIYINICQKHSVYLGDETEFTGTVFKIKTTPNKTTIYLKSSEKLVVNYYQDIKENIKIGDKIFVKGKLKLPSNNTIPNLFNYRKYLYNNDIHYIVIASSITKTANNTNIIYHIKSIISNRIDKIENSTSYLRIFILGDTSSLDESTLASYRENGISHLFSISGMHISLFAVILFYFLKRISYNNYYNYTIVISFLIFYSLLVGSSISVIRSLIMYILFAINKLFNLKIKSIDIMSLTLIITLLINPYYLYNISFQYSYTISFFLILFNYKLKYIKNKIIKSLYTSIIANLASFPICIYNFYQVNIFSIILNIILIPTVSIIIFPLSLISFFLPQISYILNIFTKILQFISLTISNHHLGVISFPKPSILIIIIYYILILLFLYNKRNIYIFLIMLIHKYSIYLNSNFEILILDIGQGDSILIKYPYNEKVILIDTGGLVNSEYKLIVNKTIPYLKSRGISKINHLILTHGDYDHMGESIELIENFKVKNVVFNCGDFNDLEKKLIKVLDKKKIKYYSCLKELNINSYKLLFLNTKEYDNENDNSNVIYFNYNNLKFLFMGDAGVDKEKDILEKYNISDIDVLKIGHHGSNTSSSKEFIDKVIPKYSIISVGKNNRYGHPNKEVLDTLNDSKIYRTDQDGSIMFKIKKDKLQIETCSP